MTTSANQQPGAPVGATLREAICTIEVDAAPDAIVATLEHAARRGHLPGYRRVPDALFRVDAFGTPFDGEVRARASVDGATTRLSLRARVNPRGPVIFGLVLAASIWPGVVLTESMIASFFPNSSAWEWTWWWYLPLTVPCCPWAYWVAWKRSQRSVAESAREAAERIARILGGRLLGAPASPAA